MKKVLLILSLFVAGTATLTSCNKALKKDVKDLDKQVADLQAQNAQLQAQANTTSAVLGANEPITATTTFFDSNDSARTVTDTYYFKANNYSTQYIQDNGDGTFDVYIERFSDVDWNEGAEFGFTYDSATQMMSNQWCEQYWSDNDPYGDYAYYPAGYTGSTVNITLTSFNLLTGDINVSVSAAADVNFSTNYPYWVPNSPKTCSTSFSFKGKLKYMSSL